MGCILRVAECVMWCLIAVVMIAVVVCLLPFAACMGMPLRDRRDAGVFLPRDGGR